MGILTYFLPIPLIGVLHLLLLILCHLLLLYPVVCCKVQSWDVSCLLPLGHILNNFEDISYYCYTADISLYLSLKPQNVTKLSVVQDCIHIIKDQMVSYYLFLNTQKLKLWSVDLTSLFPKVIKILDPWDDLLWVNLKGPKPLAIRALHRQLPPYISELLQPYITSTSLRSADPCLMAVPRALDLCFLWT